MQAEQCNIKIAASEAFANMPIKDEKKNEKERCEHETKLRKLTTYNN